MAAVLTLMVFFNINESFFRLFQTRMRIVLLLYVVKKSLNVIFDFLLNLRKKILLF